MRQLAAWGVALLGCRAPGALSPDDPYLVERAPTILSTSLSCDREAGAWRIEVEADAWASAGTLLWSVDGVWVERHETLRSVRAAPDGASDLLRADLTIVTDFRPAGAGGVTLFTCAQAPSGRVWVLGMDGEVADCVTLGPEPALVDGQRAPDCRDAAAEDTDP